VLLLGRLARDIFLDHIPAHERSVALERIAPAAAAGASRQHLRFRRHEIAMAVEFVELVFARPADQRIRCRAGLAAPEGPGGEALAIGLAEIPAALDEIAHLELDAETAAIFAGAARILAEAALLDHHRAFQFDRLNGAVAHIALADRDRAGFAVLMRPAA